MGCCHDHVLMADPFYLGRFLELASCVLLLMVHAAEQHEGEERIEILPSIWLVYTFHVRDYSLLHINRTRAFWKRHHHRGYQVYEPS